MIVRILGDRLYEVGDDDLPEIEREHDSPVDPLYRGMTLRPRTIGLQANVRF